MRMNVKHRFILHGFYDRKFLFFASLLPMVVMLISPCFISVFNGVLPFVYGTPDKVIINESELKNAVNTATGSTIIALGKDITLTNSALTIPANKDITLTSSNNEKKFYKLIGADGESVIIVENTGVLTLEGIAVTHTNSDTGCGVYVNSGGTFIMVDGKISGNTFTYNGGGVCNFGVFKMFGGVISNNIATSYGGGVYNAGVFSLSGGTISDNTVFDDGGGVYNDYTGVFSLSGGAISNNIATHGGGVYNNMGIGNFSLYDGVIYGNNANVGGGVYNFGIFSMSGGVISGNVAENKGGGVYNYCKYWTYVSSVFSLSDGVISNNTATIGGGVCSDSDFTMSGGVISGNTAINNGGGVYVGTGDFKLSGGELSSNTAYNGGGIWIDVEHLDRLYVDNSVVFSNNHASTAYNRDTVHDDVYNSRINSEITWSFSFTQGYNNYDISYTSGSQISNSEPSVYKDESSGICVYWVLVATSLILIISIVAVVLYKNR